MHVIIGKYSSVEIEIVVGCKYAINRNCPKESELFCCWMFIVAINSLLKSSRSFSFFPSKSLSLIVHVIVTRRTAVVLWRNRPGLPVVLLLRPVRAIARPGPRLVVLWLGSGARIALHRHRARAGIALRRTGARLWLGQVTRFAGDEKRIQWIRFDS